MKYGKTIARVVIIIACWYVFVFFSRSCALTHARWRAIQTRLLADAKQIERKRFSQQELAKAIGDLKLEWSLTTFQPVTHFGNETNWIVRLEPSPADPYNLPVWWRVALLDFSRAHFKAITVGPNEDAQQAESIAPVKAAPSASSTAR